MSDLSKAVRKDERTTITLAEEITQRAAVLTPPEREALHQHVRNQLNRLELIDAQLDQDGDA